MDPITQGALGAVLPQATRRNSHIAVAGLFGFFAGLAADLDVFIRSSHDPLMYLDYHRHFTHSLFFIPIGGLLAASVLYLAFGRYLKLSFPQAVLFCTLGYATHGLLDATTSYGTLLLWPFSNERFSWDLVSVIDPAFTVPILGLALASAVKRTPFYARAGLVWGALYFALALMQQQSALTMGREIAEGRGHAPAVIEVKPSFGNILVWKTVYEADGKYFVDAVRTGLPPRVFEGQSIPKLDIPRDLPWLDPASQQARDIERFRWFSKGYIAQDPKWSDRVIDIRYSLIPNEVAALWSIELSRTAGAKDHANFLTHRGNPWQRLRDLWRMIFGTADRLVRKPRRPQECRGEPATRGVGLNGCWNPRSDGPATHRSAAPVGAGKSRSRPAEMKPVILSPPRMTAIGTEPSDSGPLRHGRSRVVTGRAIAVRQLSATYLPRPTPCRIGRS